MTGGFTRGQTLASDEHGRTGPNQLGSETERFSEGRERVPGKSSLSSRVVGMFIRKPAFFPPEVTKVFFQVKRKGQLGRRPVTRTSFTKANRTSRSKAKVDSFQLCRTHPSVQYDSIQYKYPNDRH